MRASKKCWWRALTQAGRIFRFDRCNPAWRWFSLCKVSANLKLVPVTSISEQRLTIYEVLKIKNQKSLILVLKSHYTCFKKSVGEEQAGSKESLRSIDYQHSVKETCMLFMEQLRTASIRRNLSEDCVAREWCLYRKSKIYWEFRSINCFQMLTILVRIDIFS